MMIESEKNKIKRIKVSKIETEQKQVKAHWSLYVDVEWRFFMSDLIESYLDKI